MKLSESALLVQLSISQWSARKYDKRVSEEVATSHGTTSAAGRYNKALLPSSNSLKNVHQKAQYIRTKFYTNTLPWGLEGQQLLPSENYLDFMNDFRKEKAEWGALVSEFVSEYPKLKYEAQQLLPNGLYNEEDYPPSNLIHRKFKMDLAVFPVPSTDFRTQLSEAETQSIKDDIEARVGQAASDALYALWGRLLEKVEHIHQKLADPKNIFRDSTIEGTRDLCELVPKLNFAKDANLDLMCKRVSEALVSHHPESLRNDPDLRREVAAEAQIIRQVMQDCMKDIK